MNDTINEVEPLQGEQLRCPACGHRGSFLSETVLSCFLVQEPGRPVEPEWSDPPGYWGGDSTCTCEDCGHAGTVADFAEGRPTAGLSWCEVEPGEAWAGRRPALPPLPGFAFAVVREGTAWLAHSISPRDLRVEAAHPDLDHGQFAVHRA